MAEHKVDSEAPVNPYDRSDPRGVLVTHTELLAARLLVDMDERRGRQPDPVTLKISRAKPVPADEQHRRATATGETWYIAER